MADDARRRFQFRNVDTSGAPGLNRPLNDFALDVQRRLEALESVAGSLVVLPALLVTTGSVVSQGSAPFPLQAQTPENFTPSAVLVARVEDLTNPGKAPTTATTAQWRLVGGKVVLDLVTGLTANTKYRLTLVAMR